MKQTPEEKIKTALKMRYGAWEASKDRFKRDKQKIEEARMKQRPRILRFLGLSRSEKVIFQRAWWMGFKGGVDYSLMTIKKIKEVEK